MGKDEIAKVDKEKKKSEKGEKKERKGSKGHVEEVCRGKKGTIRSHEVKEERSTEGRSRRMRLRQEEGQFQQYGVKGRRS